MSGLIMLRRATPAHASAKLSTSMTLRVRDPRADIFTPPEGKRIRRLETLAGARMGLLWSQHASSEQFWPVFERMAEATLHPSEVHRLYKDSTWNVATPSQVTELAHRVDFVLVGVGG
jgi:hypothetical protein